jgi:Predicted glycosyltransferases
MSPAVSRNEPCPCGSGQRYKHCCGRVGEASAARAPSLSTTMQSAQREVRAGNFAVAERLWKELLAGQPDSVECLHVLGGICYRTNRPWDAVEYLTRALDLTDWHSATIRHDLGLVLATLSASMPRSFNSAIEGTDAKEVMLDNARKKLVAASRTPAVHRQEEGVVLLAIPHTVHPRVSIVLSGNRQSQQTFRCAKSIVANASALDYEVLLVDDGSLQTRSGIPIEMSGLRVLGNDSPIGIARRHNQGAALARGGIVVFLRADTLVTEGWLDPLVAALMDPRVGIVGARVVHPDGRLFEAGGILSQEGDASPVGRDEDANRPEYNYVRNADYASTACIAIRRADFEALGGYDPQFTQACYMEADLSMRMRAMAKDVVYHPRATIVCFGNTTAVDAVDESPDAYDANRARFVERWRSVLTAHGPRGSNPGFEKDRGCVARVLVLDLRIPAADRDSGSMRAIGVMRVLRRLGCKVTVAALNMEFASGPAAELQQDGIEVLYLPYTWTLADVIAERGGETDLIIASRHPVAHAVVDDIRRHAPSALFVFDTVDLHYLRRQREAALTGDPLAMRDAVTTREEELAVVRAADVTVVVSAFERTILEDDQPGYPIEVVSNIHALRPSVIGFESRRDMFFVGGYSHRPNVDAAQWFAREIWPKVRPRLPDVKVFLIGSEMPPAVAVLAGEGIEPVGHVPDLTSYLERCRISIAPLRYGAGVKGKINLAQSWGIPVVATTAAVEGMQLEPSRDVLVADTPDDFANAIVRLYTSPTLWTGVSEAGRANVARHYSPGLAQETLGRLLDAALEKRRTTQQRRTVDA